MNTRSLVFRSALIALVLAVLFGLGLAVRLGAETASTVSAREAAGAIPVLISPLVALPLLIHAL